MAETGERSYTTADSLAVRTSTVDTKIGMTSIAASLSELVKHLRNNREIFLTAKNRLG